MDDTSGDVCFRYALAHAISRLVGVCYFAGLEGQWMNAENSAEMRRVQYLVDCIPGTVMMHPTADDELLPGERDRLLNVVKRLRGAQER